MRVLTVRQPWAWAIIHGAKNVENRTRNVLGQHRGEFAVHAGLTEDDAAYENDMIQAAFAQYDDSWLLEEQLATGVVLGTVNATGVHIEAPRCCSSPWAQRATPYGQKPLHHIQVADPRPLPEPIPARGRLGLWTPDPDLQAAINTQLEETL